jgi:hypothetical protein
VGEPVAVVVAVPLRTWASAVEQIKTPVSAAANKWIRAIMPVS